MRQASKRRAGRTCLAIVLFVLTCLFAASSTVAAQPQSLILGVHPYLSHSALRVRFDPLADYLAEKLGMPVTVRVGNSYNDHVEAIGRNLIDIAYIGPVGYVQVANRFEPKPLLGRLETNGTVELAGHFIVRQDSPLQDLEALTGKHLGFGDPQSTMSSVLPRALLKNAGITIGNQTRYRSHTSIAIAVLSGQVDAGAVKDEVFRQFANQGLRSLTSLPTGSEHAFIARADLHEPLIEKIRSILLGLDQTVQGRQALTAVHRDASGLRRVEDTDYTPLKKLLFPDAEVDAG